MKNKGIKKFTNTSCKTFCSKPTQQKVLQKLLIIPLFSILVCFTAKIGNAQDIVKGRVIRADNKLGIPGATIVIKGTSIGTTTDTYGDFSIKILKGSVLQVKFAGYRAEEVTVHSYNPVIVELTTANLSIGLKQSKPIQKNYNTLNINTEKPKRSKLFRSYSVSFEYAYQHSNLYTAKFKENIENGLLEHGYGDTYTVRHNIYPVIIDLSGFISRYKDNIKNKNIRFQGAEITGGLNLPFLPNYFLNPNLSIGYQFSNFKNKESSINTSQPIWKFGIRPFKIILKRAGNLYIKGEYKQSLENNKNYTFNQLSVGLGFELR